ncbi:hypothetical protein R4Z09_25015 [Niallia oryzisoli]|uniref:Amino acid transporter n=1 Tax=Niallia oryzisoli TaxID=1737571 RepID=A0ABZ2C9R4_9BACI
MEEEKKHFHESMDDPYNEPNDEPFNDVIDHYNKIEGNAGKPSNAGLGQLPKPLKYFGYFIIVFFSITIFLLILLAILN